MENDVRLKIVRIMVDSPQGLTTETLAATLGLTRHTVAKYLEVLQAEGKIRFVKIGRSKLWKSISAEVGIRFLKADDLADILRLEERIERVGPLPSKSRLESLRETLAYHLRQDDPFLTLGAEIDGKLVGYVLAEIRLWEFGSGEKTGWIKVLGVDPDFQGVGIGRKLGETLLGHFARKDVKRVRTLVNWFDGPLISYFRSLGFDILNMIPLEKELTR
jgi:ribosomal protein S18 acetylase RimI-like enzyme